LDRERTLPGLDRDIEWISGPLDRTRREVGISSNLLGAGAEFTENRSGAPISGPVPPSARNVRINASWNEIPSRLYPVVLALARFWAIESSICWPAIIPLAVA